MSDVEVWNVLTMKEGHVSLVKNLTADECRAVVQRLRGDDPWSQDAIYRRVLATLGRDHPQQQNILGGAYYAYDTGPTGWAVERCEWWGSLDGKLEIWPKPDDYDARLEAAKRVAEAVNATNAAITSRAA